MSEKEGLMSQVTEGTLSISYGHGGRFYCKTKRRKVLLGKCLDDYVNMNALERTKAACWKCGQGRKVRTNFSMEG
ncbi:hypothetical protein HYV69_01100 [Candidatus Uhrbacteria bacterium]|nr:hypothetical protein [Candidatus Uhrbacteria bacterium]